MKRIKDFQITDDALFIDLEDMSPSLGIDTKTGDVFLDEGLGKNRYHGMVVPWETAQGFTLQKLTQHKEWEVRFDFGRKHKIGQFSNVGLFDKACQWIARANYVIGKKIDIKNKYCYIKIKIGSAGKSHGVLFRIRENIDHVYFNHIKASELGMDTNKGYPTIMKQEQIDSGFVLCYTGRMGSIPCYARVNYYKEEESWFPAKLITEHSSKSLVFC